MPRPNSHTNWSCTMVSNHDGESHVDVLMPALKTAEDIWIAVGFLRSSGLASLVRELKKCIKRGGRIEAYIGLSLFITEPEALRTLVSICSKGSGSHVYLCDPPGSTTFHPKAYCLRGSGQALVVVGSANLTAGGLEDNVESSLVVKDSDCAHLAGEFRAFMDSLTATSWTRQASEMLISRYERKYALMHKARRDAEDAASAQIAALREFDPEVMEGHVADYMADTERQADLANRIANYSEAKKELAKMAKTKYRTTGDFLASYGPLVGAAGKGRLWHSDGLQRGMNQVAKVHSRFVRLVALIRDGIGEPPETLFERAMKHKYENHIKGISVNVITEIMNTYAPDRYPVLNNNPLGALRFFGFKEFPASSSFKPAIYAEYSALMIDIATTFGFADLGRLDHFMNYVYWREENTIKGSDA